MSNNFTTVALLPEDKEQLDEVNERCFNGNASYRKVITELVEREEQRHDSIDEFVATVFDEVDESRARLALSRAWGDKEMVEEVSEQ